MRDVMVVVQKGYHWLGYYDFANGTELGRTPVDRFPHKQDPCGRGEGKYWKRA